jgi:hypothetical protein
MAPERRYAPYGNGGFGVGFDRLRGMSRSTRKETSCGLRDVGQPEIFAAFIPAVEAF